VITGCKSKSAFNYSENIVKLEKSLVPDMESTEKKVEKYINADQFDSIAPAGAYMESLVQKKMDEINKIPVPRAKEADNFKRAALRYFEYIKKMYTGYKNLGNAKAGEERENVIKDLQELIEGKQAAINEMQRAQRKYAEANGFRIE